MKVERAPSSSIKPVSFAKEKTSMSGSVKMKCTCKHDFQDKVYGMFMRVWTLCKGGASARCTVCGTTRVLK